jgi:osmotically-inducible protein OsmY
MTRPKLVDSGVYIFAESPTEGRPPVPRRPSPRSDQSICDDIRSRFDAASDLEGATVEVESVRGEVTLRGHVASLEERLAAMKIAARVYGVVFVHDQLTLRA